MTAKQKNKRDTWPVLAFSIPKPKWSRLKRSFRLPVYRISVVVVLVTPLIAGTIKTWHDILPFSQNLHLPLTLLLTYLSSILIIICRIIYDFACPKIIHDFQDYDHFVRDNSAPEIELLRYLSKKSAVPEVIKYPPPELSGVSIVKLRQQLQARLKFTESDHVRSEDVKDLKVIRIGYEYATRVVEFTNPTPLWIIYCMLLAAASFVVVVLVMQFFTVMSTV